MAKKKDEVIKQATQDMTSIIPNPILNKRELASLKSLQNKYEKLLEPSAIAKLGNVVLDHMPESVRTAGSWAKEGLTEAQFMAQALDYVAKGFKTMEKSAAKLALSEELILKYINKKSTSERVYNSLDEICFIRSYNVTKMANDFKKNDSFLAVVEGAGTGALGFVGIVPNIVTSTFVYFRAVQSIAMCYGYDVKSNPDELEIASGVLMSALSPGKDAANNELNAIIGKFMIFSETTAIKQTSKKTWTAMAERGGAALFITQIRALAHRAAETALKNVGAKGLEQSVFKGILEQIGKRTTLGMTGKAMPIFGAAFGALFDATQMNKILKFAMVFYEKRFIEEKEVRINFFLHPDEEENIGNVIDIDIDEIITYDEPIVYVTRGKCYHNEDCRIVRDCDTHALALSQALEKGYKPCSICEPVE